MAYYIEVQVCTSLIEMLLYIMNEDTATTLSLIDESALAAKMQP